MNQAFIGLQSERERLVAQCQLHAPPHLQRHVVKALSLLDLEVQNGRRTYSQVTSGNVLTVATKLFQHESSMVLQNTQPQAPTATGVAQKRARSPIAEVPVVKADIFSSLVKGNMQNKTTGDFVGQSPELERAYSRDEPTLDDIRPLATLREALQHVVAKSKSSGLQYLFDQLKGMRQDLRVQDIRNSFAVSVYEKHARVCLELKNLSEFNQCQSALRSFYNEGLVGENGNCRDEFLCYRLMYLTLGDKDDLLAVELKDIEKKSREEGSAAFESETVLLVLRFCGCIQQGDSHRAVKIARHFDKGMMRLLRIFLQRQRIKWLREICGSLKGSVEFSVILSALGLGPLIPREHDSLTRYPSERRRKEISHYFTTTETRNLEYLDGTFEEAHATWEDLVKLLKLSLPPSFIFEQEMDLLKAGILRSLDHTVQMRTTRQSSIIDAGALSKAVVEYCSFLTTRTDIAPE